MRVGVLTYFGDLNSGTNLQALAVTKLAQLANPGAQVEVINYHGWRKCWKPYFYNATLCSLILDIKRLYKYAKFVDALPLTKQSFVSNDVLASTRFVDSLNFDKIYVGSDTLLELHRGASNDLTVFWVDPAIGAKKIFLAPSAREVEFAALSELQRAKMSRCIEGFSKISVRDDATKRLFSNFIDASHIITLPDPTFAIDFDLEPSQLYAKKRGLDKLKKPIVCMHMHRKDVGCERIADGFKEQGYCVASLRPAPYADIILNDIGPLEVAGIFRYFKLVITHRFHDSIFCFKNGTPVIAYPPSDYRLNSLGESKFRSLFEMFGLADANLIPDYSDFSAQAILDNFQAAIDAFERNRDHIEAVLVSVRSQIREFVMGATCEG